MTFDQSNGFWIVPTRHRIKNLRRLLDAFDKTKISTYCLVVIDQNDWYLNRESYLKATSGRCNFYIVKANSLADKMHAVEASELYQLADWIGFMADDQVPETEHWDTLTLAALNGKNIVSGDDGWQAEGARLVGAVAFSKAILRITGLYPASLKHYYWDDVFETLGRETGCWNSLSDVTVKHLHHLNGKARYDSTYKANDLYLEHDKEAFATWLKSGKDKMKREILQLIEGREV